MMIVDYLPAIELCKKLTAPKVVVVQLVAGHMSCCHVWSRMESCRKVEGVGLEVMIAHMVDLVNILALESALENF